MRIRPLLAALLLFAAWTFATWFLEGRVEALLRPEAAIDRAAYALVANVLIGTLAALAVLALLARSGADEARIAGFASRRRTLMSVAGGLAVGFSLYALQGGLIHRPVIVINAFAQVLVVSIAEVVVCWALVGGTVAAMLRPGVWRFVIAAAVASVLFGLYHFAHSPPFNSLAMVALLTAVGLLTSIFFFVSHDLYGTILFHNWLGAFGVTQALAAKGELEVLAQPQLPLFAMAGVSLAALAASDGLFVRQALHESIQPDTK